MNCHGSCEKEGRRLGVEVGMSYTLGPLLHFANKKSYFLYLTLFCIPRCREVVERRQLVRRKGMEGVSPDIEAKDEQLFTD